MPGLIGQSHIISSLRDAAARGALHHAYLFVGAEGLGQEEMARWLAMLANCEGAGEKPCGACHHCHLTSTNANPDVSYVGPSDRSKAAKILIEQAQDIRREVARRPVIGRKKVVVLSPAEALTPDAVNCLLKTLEEPPDYAILVLLATDSTNVLPTVVSRCQVLRFLPVAQDELAAWLVENGVDAETAPRLARLTEGRPEEALRLARHPALLAERDQALAWAQAVSEAALPDALRLAEELRAAESGSDIDTTLRWAASWFRDVVAIQAGADECMLNDDRRGPLLRAAAVYPPGQAARAMDAIRRARRYLSGNANRDLATEALLFEITPDR